jgi:S1-C subfamily serine protease
LLTSLKKFNTIKRPFLGIKYVPLDANFAKANNIASDYGALIDPQNGIVQG